MTLHKYITLHEIFRKSYQRVISRRLVTLHVSIRVKSLSFFSISVYRSQLEDYLIYLDLSQLKKKENDNTPLVM